MDSEFTIRIDTRERLPYDGRNFGVPTVRGTLKTGDYSVVGFEDVFAIERKSPSDFVGVMTTGRARFEREQERGSKLDYFAIVVEATLPDLLANHLGKMSAASAIGTIIAWRQRYGADWWFCPNRAFAEKLTFMLCERFVRDIADGKRTAPRTEVA